MGESASSPQGPQCVLCPTDRVQASLGGSIKLPALPEALKRAHELERVKFNEGYVVAYHILPDTSRCLAILLYEFNAEIACLVHKIDVPLLPRIIREHFSETWSSVANISKIFENDHKVEWTNVGLSCSASLFSQTEAPPYTHFSNGYKGGAPAPKAAKLMEQVLLQYQCPGDFAKELSDLLVTEGSKVFGRVGGSMLQIFLQSDLAERYIYLADAGPCKDCTKVMTLTGPKVLETLRSGGLDNMQIRLIAHPDILLNSNKAHLYHYASDAPKYSEAKKQFRELIRSKIKAICSWETSANEPQPTMTVKIVSK